MSEQGGASAAAPAPQQTTSPQAVDSSPKIEKGGGESIVSFDEIEAVQKFQKSEVRQEAKKQKEIEKEKDKLSKKDKVPGKDDLVTKEQDNLKEALEENAGKEESPAKTIKFGHGDDIFEVREDATMKVTVNGKEQEVPIRELANNYSGKVEWNRRFAELGQEKRAIENQWQSIERTIDEIETASKTNLIDGFLQFSEWRGHDPVEIEKQLINEVLPVAEKLSQMDETQKELYYLKLEKKAQEKALGRYKQAEQKQKTVADINTEISQYQERFGLTKEAMEDTFSELLDLQKKGEIPKGGIDAKLVAETAAYNLAFGKVEEAIDSIDPTLQTKESLKDEMADFVVKEPWMTVQDVMDVIKEVYFGGKKTVQASKQLTDKVQKTGPKNVGAEKGTKPQHEGMLTGFDQL